MCRAVAQELSLDPALVAGFVGSLPQPPASGFCGWCAAAGAGREGARGASCRGRPLPARLRLFRRRRPRRCHAPARRRLGNRTQTEACDFLTLLVRALRCAVLCCCAVLQGGQAWHRLRGCSSASTLPPCVRSLPSLSPRSRFLLPPPAALQYYGFSNGGSTEPPTCNLDESQAAQQPPPGGLLPFRDRRPLPPPPGLAPLRAELLAAEGPTLYSLFRSLTNAQLHTACAGDPAAELLLPPGFELVAVANASQAAGSPPLPLVYIAVREEAEEGPRQVLILCRPTVGPFEWSRDFQLNHVSGAAGAGCRAWGCYGAPRLLCVRCASAARLRVAACPLLLGLPAAAHLPCPRLPRLCRRKTRSWLACSPGPKLPRASVRCFSRCPVLHGGVEGSKAQPGVRSAPALARTVPPARPCAWPPTLPAPPTACRPGPWCSTPWTSWWWPRHRAAAAPSASTGPRRCSWEASLWGQRSQR